MNAADSRPVETQSPAAAEPQRLQKVLAAAGIGSRRTCEQYIRGGRVQVDGKVVTKLGTTVDPEVQEIRFDGETVAAERKSYWLAYKPRGVVSTTRDEHGRATVVGMVPDDRLRLYPVGRLDEESTGLMLLTNDGAMADVLTHPRYGVPKTYHLKVAGKIGGEVISRLTHGIWLSDGRVRARSIKRLRSGGDASELEVVLTEGHNRELRRMFARMGHKVMHLNRTAIGPVKIRQLRPGGSRPATGDEVRMLRDLVRQVQSEGRFGSSSQPGTGPRPPRRTGGRRTPPGRPSGRGPRRG